MNNTVTKLPVEQDYKREQFKICSLYFVPTKFSVTKDMIEKDYNGYYPPTVSFIPAIGFGRLYEYEFNEDGEKLVRCRGFQIEQQMDEDDDPLEYVGQIWFKLRDWLIPEGVIVEELHVELETVDMDDFVQPSRTISLEYTGDIPDNVIQFEEVKND